MKILIIAPNLPDLPGVPDEVAGLANRVASVLLQGTVTKSEIISAIEKEGTFEGFWFASHGNDKGVLLSNGKMFSGYDIASYANAANCEWVVLNSCDSNALVTVIQNLSMVDIVATESGDIADEAAWQFGRLLAIEYSKTGKLRQAVQAIAPGSTVHRYYRNERFNMMTRQNTTPAQMLQTDQTLEDKINRLIKLVEGDRSWGIVGITQQMQDISDRLGAIEKKQTQADEERSELSAKLTTAYYGLIALALGVMVGTVSIVWLFASSV